MDCDSDNPQPCNQRARWWLESHPMRTRAKSCSDHLGVMVERIIDYMGNVTVSQIFC